MRNLLKTFACFILFNYSIYQIKAQPGQSEELKYFLEHCQFLLKDGGKWKVVNKDFDPKDENSPNYFGYEYANGLNENTLLIKSTAYFPKISAWKTMWDGFYTWNAKNQKLIFQSVHTAGSIVSGESENMAKSGITFINAMVSADGSEKKQKYMQTFTSGMFHSTSYQEKNNNWEILNTSSWSRLEQPTGNLTFMCTRDGNFEIYSMDVKGEHLKNLSCNKATDYAFSYAKDGRLAFYSNRDGNNEIYIMDAEGKKQTNISNHPSGDRVPFFSPDGKQVLFISDRDHKSGELYVMDADGKNLKRLTNNEYFEDAAGWSNDGKKIYFSRELRDLKDTSANAPGNGEIFVMDADGSNDTRLTNRPGFDGGPTLSPDGTTIAFYGKTTEGKYDIFLMDTDGKNIINLTDDAWEDYSPAWSPDGKWIAYTSGNSKNYDVWLIHLQTRIKTRLTTQPKRDESPIWQPVK